MSKSKRASDKPSKKHKLPDFIWAQWSDDAGETLGDSRPFLLARQTPEGAGDYHNDAGVGVYKLVRVVKLSNVTTAVETTLESYE